MEEAAITYAKEHKKRIAAELTDIQKYPPDEIPVSVFMAGSPGAGKTETSKNLLAKFSKDSHPILRIDPDEIRELIPGYTGSNSSEFQAATSIIADKMQDIALRQCQSYIFDGTLTNLTRATENITRSLSHKRIPYIIYVYQDALQAWQFVKEREHRDGRNIPKTAFIDQYFRARTNVNVLKAQFGKELHVDLVIKNIDGTDFGYRANIDSIDGHVPQVYTEGDLDRLLD